MKITTQSATEILHLIKILQENDINLDTVAFIGKGLIPGYVSDVVIGEFMGITIVERVTSSNSWYITNDT